MGTMGGTESIVDEQVERGSKLLNEFWFVLGLLLVESGVLKHDNISLLGGINNSSDALTNAVGSKSDILSKKLSHALSTRSKRKLVLRTILGASQMRADRNDGALALEVFNGGDGGSDTGVVGDFLSVKRDVDITSDQDLLSLEVTLGEILDRLLGFKLEEGKGRRLANSERCRDKGRGRRNAGGKSNKDGGEEFHLGYKFTLTQPV
mmetsp:Transcript_32907/g.48726  ORF Transcript_32907/g.48726 Transcript_32907/m.48726 type:complete len:207 (+) Transcript_32907:922-1542(+)